jgi:hypothetical protein
MPDPAEYADDNAPFAPGQTDANTLDLWDLMSGFGSGVKERYENRVYVYLEALPSADGKPAEEPPTNPSANPPTNPSGEPAENPAAEEGRYLPAEPPYFDVTLMTGQQQDAREAYIQEIRPGFIVNHKLTSAAWQNGPGVDHYTPGTPSTWGATGDGANLPAQCLSIYYDRKVIELDFFCDTASAPFTIVGKYGEPLFAGGSVDWTPIQEALDTKGRVFLGWYTSPNGFGGHRVDDPASPLYQAGFPDADMRLFAHWAPEIIGPNPPDTPDFPDVPGLPGEPGGSDNPLAPENANIPSTASGAQPVSARSLIQENAESASATQAKEEQTADETGRTSGEPWQYQMPGTTTPQGGFFQKDIPLIVWQPGETWSFSNCLFSFLGLGEALIVIGSFFLRNRRMPLNLLTSDFVIRGLVLFLAIALVASTSITSDFAKEAVVFDEMSLPVVLLFGIQQALLFGTQKMTPFKLRTERRKTRFRAKKRYESNK